MKGIHGDKPDVTRVYTRRQPQIPTLNTRTTPAAFHDALLKLNHAQKCAIREIGFGSVLQLKVKDLPGKLAYWILNKFNVETCELDVDARRRVPVTENDVYRIFGFPSGKHSIPIFNKQSTSDLFEQWFSFFGVDSRDKVKIGLVIKHMLDCKSGGTWFKRHFMIALGFSMFESCSNGKVHPFILNCLTDLNGLRKWNWAGYMISSLKKHTKSWMGDENKMYTGPALFIILFYVDRVSLHGLISKREFPILKNWSSDGLRKRQRMDLDKKYIGKGCIQDPLELPIWYDVDVIDLAISDEEKDLANSLMREAHEIAVRMNKISSIVDNAPISTKKSAFFLKNVDEACELTGMKIDIVIPKDKAPNPIIEIFDDPIEYTDDFFAWVDKTSAEALDEKKKEINRAVDIPTFDLGLADDNSFNFNQNQDSKYEKGSDSPVMGLVCTTKRSSDECQTRRTETVFVLKENHCNALRPREISTSAERKALSSIDTNVVVIEDLRNETTKKILRLRSANFQSHRNQHGICTRLQLGKQEKQIGMYALHKDTGEEGEILFSFKDIVLTRHDMMSLKRGNSVLPSIIGVWGIILNLDDHSRSERIPTRFYASTDIHVNCVAHVGEPYESKRKNNRFIHGHVFPFICSMKLGDVPTACVDKEFGITRKKINWMKGSKFRSPFVQREVCPSRKLTKQEKELGIYCMYSETRDRFEILFSHKESAISRYEMQSLRKGCVVSTSIINAWCVFLNSQEDMRSNYSPLRFFASTSFYTEIICSTESSYEEQSKMFIDMMTSEIKMYQNHPLHLIDIFFFPVFADNLYYALAYDLKKERIFVLDSTVDLSCSDNSNKYDVVCNNFRRLLTEYLYYLSEERRAATVSKSMFQIVKMKWADIKNIEDTGIYLMRHLETFMGDSSSSWKCMSSVSANRQLRLMRVRYCSTLIIWEGNQCRVDVTNEASGNLSEVCANPRLNVNLMLVG